MAKSVIVVGAGIFGVTAAIELANRGWATTLLDPGPPHPLAASTDISKMIRADYGTDELYISLMEACLPTWRDWNERWGEDLFHEEGFLVLAGGRMEPGGYEHTSSGALLARNHPLDVLSTNDIRSRFPAWAGPPALEGYYNPLGGWAASGLVVGRLLGTARDAGVTVVEGRARRLLTNGATVRGVLTEGEAELTGDITLVAAGAWTPDLVPGLEDLVSTTGHPIMHLRPDDIGRFTPPAFPPWAADIANTGWYGFPATDGVVKVANHGPGAPIGAEQDRLVDARWEGAFRAFLADWIPSLSTAEVVYTRLCLYTDTRDGDFVIDRHGTLDNLVLATGGSGHGFKFAPMLGTLAADAVEEERNRFSERFAWRTPPVVRTEAARGRREPGPGR